VGYEDIRVTGQLDGNVQHRRWECFPGGTRRSASW
jgi:hypothetical protein